MILDRFNSTFPKATKVGYSRWKEIPVISLRFFFYKVNVWFSIKLCNLESSLFASTKFVALSENNFEHKPLSLNMSAFCFRSSRLLFTWWRKACPLVTGCAVFFFLWCVKRYFYICLLLSSFKLALAIIPTANNSQTNVRNVAKFFI